MGDFATADIFSDNSIAQNPFPYFDYLRAKGPVTADPNRNVVHVTGYAEGLEIFRNDDAISAINTTSGPFMPFEFDADGDMDAQIAACRAGNPHAQTIVSQDMPDHARSKSIMNGIITPARLKSNEAFMLKLADQLIDDFADKDRFEAVADFGALFARLTVADLLGVPEEDHDQFRSLLGGPGDLPHALNGEFNLSENPLLRIAGIFAQYIMDRRAHPREDALTRLAQQRYDDGTLPEVMDVVAVATFLFGAGQDTTVMLIAAMLRFLGDDQALQARLRANPQLIPDFVEETIRLEGTVKSGFRLVRKPISVGGVDLKPGTHLMMHIAAMDRDPRQFADPNALNIDRPNLRTHFGFGRGLHACAGGPLARAEARITIERLFARTSNIRINEAEHGPAENRHYNYLPNYSLRGVFATHVEFDAA